MMAFLDRERELAMLEGLWGSSQAEFLVLYGRRRVGKTHLLEHFFSHRQRAHYVATEKVAAEQLREVTDQIEQLTQDPLLAQQPLASWDAVFTYLGQVAMRVGRLAIVLDEYQYLVGASPDLPSILQRWWDRSGHTLPIMLVLCGSYVHFMERVVLGSGAPTYGRRTAQHLVEPFDYWQAGLFFPAYEPADRLRAYAVLGGMPAYLSVFSDGKPLAENIRQHLLRREQFLAQEANYLLAASDVREQRVYASIFRALATGHHRPSEIAQELGMTGKTENIYPYLDRLLDLRLVERRVPVTEQGAARSQRAQFHLADLYLAFWHRYIGPNTSLLELGREGYVLQRRILPTLDEYVSRPFEDMCAQFLRRMLARDATPVVFDRIGRWWRDNEEIDLLALDGDEVVLAGECKWRNQWTKLGDLFTLKRRAELVGAGPHTRYVLFSRSGFDPNLVAAADSEHTDLYTLDDLFRVDLAGPPSPP